MTNSCVDGQRSYTRRNCQNLLFGGEKQNLGRRTSRGRHVLYITIV